jgi:hypothetical protein
MELPLRLFVKFCGWQFQCVWFRIRSDGLRENIGFLGILLLLFAVLSDFNVSFFFY